MAGLMSRTSAIAQAKFSKLLDRAEDPGETLDYSYEQQLQQLQNVKRGIADVTTAKKRLEMEDSSDQQQLAKLDDQARQALAASREDLAREALTRKAALQAQIDSLKQQEQQLADQQQKLIAGEQALQTKIEAFRSQKEVIKAQYSAAEAQVKIGEAATGHRRAHGRRRARDPAGPGQDPADAGTRRRGRRADHLGCARGLHLAGRRPRPAALADLAGKPGRRRAREDEGRARARRRRPGRRCVGRQPPAIGAGQ